MGYYLRKVSQSCMYVHITSGNYSVPYSRLLSEHRIHDRLNYEGSIFVHFHLLINMQFNFNNLVFVGVMLFDRAGGSSS